ncbi:MAG: hypothetical protein KAJ03_01270 [Gammaproteobacteria bacterium]|nr:hypothetical protein [Gammaproteobacteria bacterium]
MAMLCEMSITGIDMTDDKLLETPQCEEITYGADCPHEGCNEWNEFECDVEGEVATCEYRGKKFLVTG